MELKKLNWRDFIRQDNPVAGALLSKMGYTESEKIEVKKEFLRMLIRLELDPARTQVLMELFETYLKLNEEEEEQFLKEINKNPREADVLTYVTSYERKGIEKGKLEGKLEGKKDAICTYLNSRFGSSSLPVQEKIRIIGLPDRALEAIFTAQSLEEVEKIVEHTEE